MVNRSSSQSGYLLATVLIVSIIVMVSGITVLHFISNSIALQSRLEQDRVSELTAASGMTAGFNYYNTAQISTSTSTLTGSLPGLYYVADAPGASNTDVGPLDRSYRSVVHSSPYRLHIEGASTNRLGFVNHTSSLKVSGDTSLIVDGSTQISSGDHSCLITDGKVFCWGNNSRGQLGNGNTRNSNTPVEVTSSGVIRDKTISAISTGSNNTGGHTCAVATNGRAYCWGNNSRGQLGNGNTRNSNTPVEVGGLLAGRTVTQISAGQNHTCAIADGRLFCWGDNASGQLGGSSSASSSTPIATKDSGALSGRAITKISAGQNHTCAIADEKAFCWGANSNGQLGNGLHTLQREPTPVQTNGVLIDKAITDISTSDSHTCAVADSRVFCWGSNSRGQLGDETRTSTASPVPVKATGILGGKTVTQVSVNHTGSCALADGRIYCWGSSTRGQLGNGTTTDSTEPVVVDTSGALNKKTATSVSLGDETACAIASGKAYCWGQNNYGQLGDGTNTNRSTAVTLVVGGPVINTASGISAGREHSCVVINNSPYCWGKNNEGQLGNGTNNESTRPTAVRMDGVLAGKLTSQVQSGGYHSCAIDSDSKVHCWGGNDRGQLGNGSTSRSSTPTAVITSGVLRGKAVTQVSTGYNHTCAIASNEAYCWGSNNQGQLGNNSTSNSSNPVAVHTGGVLRGKRVTYISAGYDHTCAVADGKAYCWGSNDRGQLGNNSMTGRNTTPVAVRDGGSLRGKRVTHISTGQDHTCAVADGKAYCWGEGHYGRLGTGNETDHREPASVQTTGPLTGKTITSVEAGYHHSCALTDGRIFCWGSNDKGQLGNNGGTGASFSPTEIRREGHLVSSFATQLSLSHDHACTIANNTVYCWGWNQYGQIGDGSKSNRNKPTQSDTASALPAPSIPSSSSSIIEKLAPHLATISSGGEHTCALTNGNVHCWGWNRFGQLGDGTNTNRHTPIAVRRDGVLKNKTITQVAAGYNHTCALSNDNRIFCWGSNDRGQLGNNSRTDSKVPVAVKMDGALAGKIVTQIYVGGSNSCAVASNRIYCWGNNSTGQVGDGTTNTREVPVAVKMDGALAGKRITQISVSGEFVCALADGNAFCWGENDRGQIGDGTTHNRHTPAAVIKSGSLAGKPITQISTGSEYACALANNKAYCWGYNWDGQLGDGTLTHRRTPVEVKTDGALRDKKVTHISAGWQHTCATAEGKAYCWGLREFGQLGDGTTSHDKIKTPVAVNTSGELSSKIITQTNVDSRYSCAVADGRVYCWGQNNYGQLGDGQSSSRDVPIATLAPLVPKRMTLY